MKERKKVLMCVYRLDFLYYIRAHSNGSAQKHFRLCRRRSSTSFRPFVCLLFETDKTAEGPIPVPRPPVADSTVCPFSLSI